MSDAFDPYKVLQVDPEAEDEVIQAAYRRLAQKYHPDRSPGQDAFDRMVSINRAWEAIGEPAARASFDRARRAHSAPPSPGPARPPSPGQGAAPPPATPRERPQETVSPDWTSGRSSTGGGYDARTMRAPEGLGAAGPPPGNPSGTVLAFGRYAGWSLGEIGRRDIEYVEWLDRMPIGRPYRDEIDGILRRAGRRKSTGTESAERRGLFRRR